MILNSFFQHKNTAAFSEACAGSSQLSCLRPGPTALRREQSSLSHTGARRPGLSRELRAPSAARPQREPSRAGPRRSSPASPADQSAPGSAKRTNGEGRGAGTAGAAGQWRAAGGGHCGPSARPAGAPSERGRCLGTASCPWLRPLVRNHFCAHTEITGHDLLN